jgi:hypothetical protein
MPLLRLDATAILCISMLVIDRVKRKPDPTSREVGTLPLCVWKLSAYGIVSLQNGWRAKMLAAIITIGSARCIVSVARCGVVFAPRTMNKSALSAFPRAFT